MSTTPLTDEPLLAMQDIQGNILDGFNKDHQAFIFLAVSDSAGARKWLGRELPKVSSAEEVHRFNQLFRAMRARQGRDPVGLAATWMNIAFTVNGVAEFVSREDADKFGDPFFRQGMRRTSADLMDVDGTGQTGHPGHVDNWLMGGTDSEVHAIVIVASDDEAQLRTEIDRLSASLGEHPSLRIVHLQWGKTLPPPLTGHEHFGFKDGVSQPGIRGRVEDGIPVTRRLVSADDPQQNDPRNPEYSKPGQPLIWPGQFVFGYPRQSLTDKRAPANISSQHSVPEWAANGSYLVCRRLRQDVGVFDRFVAATAAKLAAEVPALAALTPFSFAAMMVGRWPSGSPLMRNPIPGPENTALGADKLSDNDFLFIANTRPLNLNSEAGEPGSFSPARRDPLGRTCPFSSHIRKVNPRDTTTEKGQHPDTLCRLILRRGIPFGDPLPDRDHPEQDPLHGDRGLMFLSYQTSIEEQFIVLNGEWANSDSNPSAGGGHDPIIGQTNLTHNRERFFEINLPNTAPIRIPLPAEWVTMTGGDYFFAPSLSALRSHFCELPAS